MTRSHHAVIVTGANRGIGASISKELLRNGFSVACVSRRGDLPKGLEVAEDPKCRAYTCDVVDDASMRACFARVAEDFGGIRALINNAGVHSGGRSDTFASEDFLEMLNVNTVGTFAASREAYPYLKDGGGDIINIGSIFETIGAPANVCYSASKAAVGGMTRALASEWGPLGVNVINLAPGYVVTDMNAEYMARKYVCDYFKRQTTLGRALTAEEVGRMAAHLLEMDLSILNGQSIRADGGHSICHGVIGRLPTRTGSGDLS